MIDAATAIATPPPRRAAAQPARGAGDDFETTLKGVRDAPEAAAKRSRGLTGRKLESDAPAQVPDAPVAGDSAEGDAPIMPRTCGTGRPGKGKGIAGGGNILPGVSEDEPAKEPIWLPVGMIAPLPNPAVCPLVLPKFAAAVAPATVDNALSSTPAPPPVGASPAQAGAQSGDDAAPSMALPNWAPASAGEAPLGEAPGGGALGAKNAGGTTSEANPIIAKGGLVLPPSLVAAKADAPARIDVPAAVAPQAPQPSVPQPAGQVFAAAIAAVHAQPHRDEPDTADPHTPLAIATAALDAVHTPVAIAATADTSQGALDLRQDSGLQRMIDHIEVLRDDADAGDTRIRLVPDALGAVDVSVRKDGDRVHVHFNAENAASARLLSDAQPRLADLAEARGVKLGQTSVDSNAGQPRQQPQPGGAIATARPAAPTRADPADLLTDIRIA